MSIDQIVSAIVSILSGLVVCIPLAVKLAQYVQKAAQEKNWSSLLGLAIDLMEQGECKFEDGATRKDWVMAMVKTSAEYVNYPIDENDLSALLDTLCSMTKIVNAPAITTEEAANE